MGEPAHTKLAGEWRENGVPGLAPDYKDTVARVLC